MANEIQVFSSFPTLKNINKSLKVIDKLLPSCRKLTWNELGCDIKYYIFCCLLRWSSWAEYFEEKEKPFVVDRFFKFVISHEDEMLSYYNKMIGWRENIWISISADVFLEYGVDIVIDDPKLLCEYSDYFGFEVCKNEKNECKLSRLWERLEFDFSVLEYFPKSSEIDRDFSLKFRFSEELDIRYKNINWIKQWNLKYIGLDNIALLDELQLKKIFSGLDFPSLPYNFLSFGYEEELFNVANYQKIYEAESKYAPFVRKVEIGPLEAVSIYDYTFLLNFIRLECLSIVMSNYNGTENLIKSISNLKYLKKLELEIWDDEYSYRLNDISFLSNLEYLEELKLYNCSPLLLLDISVLYNLKNLKEVVLNLVVKDTDDVNADDIEWQSNVQSRKLRERYPELSIYIKIDWDC